MTCSDTVRRGERMSRARRSPDLATPPEAIAYALDLVDLVLHAHRNWRRRLGYAE